MKKHKENRVFELILILILFAVIFLANALPRHSMAVAVQEQIGTYEEQAAEGQQSGQGIALTP